VAVSERPVEELLERLALALALSSSGVLLTALVAGRWCCRRALRPVAHMAEQARTMKAEQRENRLSIPSTRDEVESLGVEFNGLLDRLHEALERQRRFTGDASHQLRTPLAALLGQVEVALRHPRTVEDYRQTLTHVQDQGRHLRQIVEMLLYLARADAEARLDDLVPLDLSSWLASYVSTWADHPRSRDLQIASSGGMCRVKVHPPLLSQMLGNLLDNAFKYSDPGSPVVVRLAVEKNRATIAVEDRGIGVNENDRPNLFEPFYRSDRARVLGRSGVGLGLSVAQRIARLFGGEITTAANVGNGSTFVVSLPLDDPDAQRG
jgi:two-component system OmpR family sensor kinase